MRFNWLRSKTNYLAKHLSNNQMSITLNKNSLKIQVGGISDNKRKKNYKIMQIARIRSFGKSSLFLVKSIKYLYQT